MSEQATFSVRTEHSIDRSLIPEDSYLEGLLHHSGDDDGATCDNADIVKAIEYLQGDQLPVDDPELEAILDYFGVYPYSSYDQVFGRELHFRDNMYNPEFKEHPMNEDLRYNLVLVDEEVFNDLSIAVGCERNDLLFKKKPEKITRSGVKGIYDSSSFGKSSSRKVAKLDSGGYRGYKKISSSSSESFDGKLRRIRRRRIRKRRYDSSSFSESNSESPERETSSSSESSDMKISNRRRPAKRHINTSSSSESYRKLLSRSIRRKHKSSSSSSSESSSSEDIYRNTIKKNLWGRVQNRLQQLNVILRNYDNIFVAGGFLLYVLFDIPSHDIDVFFVGADEKQANRTIKRFCKDIDIWKVTRSKHVIEVIEHDSFQNYQFVLRLYKSYSEVLHGFDVDSCCLGYDGHNIYATKRAIYAINKGYNTFNPYVMSPSYEYRLFKYGNKGFPLHVPELDFDRINREALEEHIVIKAHKNGFKESINALRDRLYNVLPNTIRSVLSKYDIPFMWNPNSKGKYTNLGKITIRLTQSIAKIYRGNIDMVQEVNETLQLLDDISNPDRFYPTFFEELEVISALYNKKDIKVERYIGLNLLLFLDAEFHKASNEYLEDKALRECKQESDYDVQHKYGYPLSSQFKYLLEKYTEDEGDIYEMLRVCRIYLQGEMFKELFINKVNHNNDIRFISTSYLIQDIETHLNFMFSIPTAVYDILSALVGIDMPQNVEYKTINPGEQTNAAFRKLEYDSKEWFEGPFYYSDDQ